MKKRTKKKLTIAALYLLIILVFGGLGYLCGSGVIPFPDLFPTEPGETLPPAPVTGSLTVHYIDVGQADSILLSCGGEYMLIDGGNRDDGDLVVDYLRDQGVQRLEYVVGTHPHEDHMGGLDEVLLAFPTETFWTPEPDSSDLDKVFMQRVMNAAESQNLAPTQPELGKTYALGDARVTLLGPVRYDYDDTNDLSLIFLVQFGSTRFLFTGDAEKTAEHDMLEYWGDDYDFHADVLKVGHHGSTTSTGYRLLRMVDPAYAVIPAGAGNSYGHPHRETLDILGDAEVLTYRTDYLGTVIAASDGTDITFSWTNTGNAPYIPD